MAARPLQLSYIYSICFGVMGVTLGKTVLQRRDRLEQIINPVPGIQVGGHVENSGKDLFQLAKEKGFEGIIAKRKTSTYRPGKRSPDWLKIKGAPTTRIRGVRSHRRKR